MAVRDWLKKIIESPAGSERPAKPSPPLRNNAPTRKPRSAIYDAISYAVNLSGLVIDQPEAMAFYQTTFADHPSRFVTYDDLRKQGDLLDKDALKALGLRANVKISAQFLATLNESGRADPLGAASVIGLSISTALCTLRNLGNMEAAGIEFVEFHASNMAAGPCGASARLDSQRLPIGEAEQLPFKSCPHPDQCGCDYQSRLSLTGEF